MNTTEKAPITPESFSVTSPTTATVWSNYRRILKGDLLKLGTNPVVRVTDARPIMSVDGMYKVEVEAI